MIKAIIFDCFGVVYSDKFDLVYTHFGGDLIKDAEFIEQTFFEASKGLLESGIPRIAEHIGVTEEQWREYQDEIRGYNEQLLEYIKELRSNFKIGMLSNIGGRGLSSFLDYKVLVDNFDTVVESAKIGFAKPEARAYEITAERLGVRLDECVFVDDRQSYIEGAKAVGMKTILFEDFEKFKKDLEKLLSTSNE